MSWILLGLILIATGLLIAYRGCSERKATLEREIVDYQKEVVDRMNIIVAKNKEIKKLKARVAELEAQLNINNKPAKKETKKKSSKKNEESK